MKTKILFIVFLLLLPAGRLFAQDTLQNTDSDSDGLSDHEELNIYSSNVNNPDSDNDSYTDGEEVKFSYDPNKAGDDKLEKSIVVVLADQSLSYKLGDYIVNSFKISGGVPKTPTPPGEYSILKKIPVVNYIGADYSYKNTRWNLMFRKSYYIHGAYWHNNFGQPMSHGCVNVAYANVEGLYNWAEVGTRLTIK
jgi:hypothetical protein